MEWNPQESLLGAYLLFLTIACLDFNADGLLAYTVQWYVGSTLIRTGHIGLRFRLEWPRISPLKASGWMVEVNLVGV